MQLISMFGAVALLSTSAVAQDHWWQFRNPHQGGHRRHHHPQGDQNLTPDSAITSKSDANGTTAVSAVAYTTEYFILPSGDTTDYGSAYTTVYSTEEAISTTPTSSLGGQPLAANHKHHHNHHHHIALTSGLSCPVTVSTKWITVTASTTSIVTANTTSNTSTTYAGKSYNSSTNTQIPSQGLPTSSANISFPSTSTQIPSQGLPTLNASSSSAWANYSTSGHVRHYHTRLHHALSTSSIATVIFVSASPVSVATGTDLHPSLTVIPTTTITGGGLMNGTPNPAAYHCGVNGLPVGDYYLAEFVENKPGEDVTLLGCYEFCTSVYGVDKGCVSYEFYLEPGLGASRCALYGGSVADSLASISDVPNIWYDLGCGNPVV